MYVIIVNMTSKTTTKSSVAKKNYHHGDLKSALVSAARELIESGGSGHLTMRRVSEAVGVSPAAAYRHFSDRESLLAAVLQVVFDDLQAAMKKGRLANSNPLQAFFATGYAYIDFAQSHPNIYRVLFSEECQMVMHPELLKSGEAAFNEVHQAAKDCAAAGLLSSRDPIEIAMAGWVNVHGLASLYLDGVFSLVVPLDIESATRSIFETLIDGVAPSAGDFLSQQIRKTARKFLPKAQS